jgi:hypothetical protein
MLPYPGWNRRAYAVGGGYGFAALLRAALSGLSGAASAKYPGAEQCFGPTLKNKNSAVLSVQPSDRFGRISTVRRLVSNSSRQS